MLPTLISSLRNIVGADHVLSGETATPYCTDWRGRYSGKALAVVLPGGTQQVSAVVALCAEHRVAIVPQGGNTSLCGGSVPLPQGQQLVLNLSRMNKIHAPDTINYTLTVEAGCTLATAREAAERVNRLFPLGLSAIAAKCEIGGNISTNAGGVGVLRYGNMRDLVLGLEVVLPDGRIWDGLRSLRKDNTGYDLKHLFIGAEGTLGIITAAVLKLFPRPQSVVSACVAVRDPAVAVQLLAHLRANCGDKISAFEIISSSCLDLVLKHIPDTTEPFVTRYEWIVLIELSDVLQAPLDAPLRNALQTFSEGILEFAVDSKNSAGSWWNLRKNISEAQKREGISIKHDVAVPISHVAEFIAQTNAALHAAYNGLRIIAFGHIGDGNIHYNLSMLDSAQNAAFIAKSQEVNSIVYDIVHGLNGSISAEHGLGQLKRNEMNQYKSALELELMRSIKHTLDPNNLMNPGKVI
ncbi:FAD/FMN-containing dehydrogenase [Candidatus Nitrotoga sp. BS]|uniref:FAD-binding oxidoreductase n=1 Tax=Candidatus Nitrotoga sp. BS TaxID=2890408 RepID=UPI001EF1A97A|nr:FAD-binding oxidoreductase [Candidatus Nitrotoga sp. BS]CAH1189494.1 FAD/FMN-containing dehydrogenase [Candidatus Nitrotoga sp. BS]